MSYTSSSLASSAVNNIVILSALNALYAFIYPGCLVMVKSRTETVHLDEEEAKVLRAMDSVARQTASDNRQEDVLTIAARRFSKKVTVLGKRGSKGGEEMEEKLAKLASSKVVPTGDLQYKLAFNM